MFLLILSGKCLRCTVEAATTKKLLVIGYVVMCTRTSQLFCQNVRDDSLMIADNFHTDYRLAFFADVQMSHCWCHVLNH